MENIAESEFRKWLDKNSIPYWYIHQDLETFSNGLKKYFTKRPDFFLLIPNFGFILIDIKDKKSAEKYEKFFIDSEDVEKYLNLQRIFNLPLWYVISNDNYHYKTWFWIPVSVIAKTGLFFQSKEKGNMCYSVPISEFIQVSYDDSLERVFTKFLNY